MNDFWKKKKVLITGHTGFKGGWLAVFLKTLGSELYGISKSKENGIYDLANLSSIFKGEFFLDIGNDKKEKIEEILNEVKPDIIFHFAAQAIVSIGHLDPLETIRSNTLGTLNLCLAIKNSNYCKSVVVATTDKVYKNNEEENKENSFLGGNDFYSLSKVGAENIISILNDSFKNEPAISTVRSGNVLGGGDRGKDRLVVDLVSSFLNDEIFFVRNKKSIRPWQYVLDSIYGYLLIGEKNYTSKISEIYNLNSKINNEYTVEFLIKQFEKTLESEIKIDYLQESFSEKNILRLDSSKARDELNWSTETSIEKTISKIINWEQHYKNIDSASIDYCIKEIIEFLEDNSLNYKLFI